MIGVKLAASRRADDPLLDPICALAAERGVPVLQHIWQHRRRDYPGQEASDAVELGRLAVRHRSVPFILAHIGGGGDWLHTLPVVGGLPNVLVDLSGSGVDGGMLEACIDAVGVERLLWGCDLTIETGWAKLRYLERLLSPADLERVALAQCREDLPSWRLSRRLMRVDVNAFLGSYPYRRVPGTSADALLAAMDRVGIDQAWVSHLPGIFWRDPAAGNEWLLETAGRQPRLRPVLAVHPEMAGWEQRARGWPPGRARRRCEPTPRSTASPRADRPCAPSRRPAAAPGCPLMLAVRLEDGRQRHPNDHAADLPAAAVRALIRADPRVRLIVTHADRPFIEEVHFGATPDEAARIWWDISWVWGPPEDHLETLLRTVGPARFRLRHRAAAPYSRERRSPSSICWT